MYDHFLLLHVAIRVLCNPLSQSLIDYGGNLHKKFVQTSVRLYGTGFMSYNVHSLLHLHVDCHNFGSLDNFSGFVFENHLGFLKRKIRSGFKPLQQVVARITESSVCKGSLKESFAQEHADGPLPSDMSSTFLQYKCYVRDGLRLSPGLRNSYFSCNDGSIHKLFNVVKFLNGDVLFVTKKLLSVRDFFLNPVASSELHVYLCDENAVSQDFTAVPSCKFAFKFCALSVNNDLVLMRLVHQ